MSQKPIIATAFDAIDFLEKLDLENRHAIIRRRERLETARELLAAMIHHRGHPEALKRTVVREALELADILLEELDRKP